MVEGTTTIGQPQLGKGDIRTRTRGAQRREQFGSEGSGKATYGTLALSMGTVLATGGLNSQNPSRDDVLH